MASITIPMPLIRYGLLPQPHLAPGVEISSLGGMSADELREFFLHAVWTLEPAFILLTWAGYDVVHVEVAQVGGHAATGTPARLEVTTMEIREGSWTPPADATDGTYVVLFVGARPGLAGSPMPLAAAGLPNPDEIVTRLDDDPSHPWGERLYELLPQLGVRSQVVEDSVRSTIRSARGAATPAAWIRDPPVSGFLSMYDYTSWGFDVLEDAPSDWSSPIRRVGEAVWAAITVSGEVFDRFLDEEPARAAEVDLITFPGGPVMSAFRRILTLDAPGATAHMDALSHNVDAANLARPGLLSAADLHLLSYTGLLTVLAEAGILAIGAAPLSGEGLRQQILLRLDELAPLAHQVLEALEDWQETNYSDFAHALEGQLPSTALDEWRLGLIGNLLAESIGTVAPLAAGSLVVWIAGAAVGLTVGVETVIGFTVGLAASIVIGDLLSPSEASEASLITDAHEQSLHLEQLWHQKVRAATLEASGKLDDQINELRLQADPFTDESLLQDLYSKVLADLEVCAAQPVPPLDDRSLADTHLHMWLLEKGWGFKPYDDEGQFAPTNALMSKIRDRVLVWPREDNHMLFLSQCAYEWRSLGFACEPALEAIGREAETSAEGNEQRFQGREFTFSGFEMDPLFREKWKTRYGSSFTSAVWEIPPDLPDGSTRITERGFQEIGNGAFRTRCTLRLTVTAANCRVTAFEYRVEGNSDAFAVIFVDVDPDATLPNLEPFPSTHHDYTVVPDRPVF